MLLGMALRFYNLNWGAPYYFHPDERNIASSISQLNLPNNVNPNFFAYGSLPIYTIYFTGILLTFILGFPHLVPTVLFEQAIIIGRFYSALFSLLLIPLLYLIGKKLYNQTTGILAAFFATFSVGLIQFAHFATFEIWQTFFTVLLFYACLKLTKTGKHMLVFISSILVGCLLSIKVSNLPLLVFPPLAIFLHDFKSEEHIHRSIFKKIRRFCRAIVITIFTAALTWIIFSPFSILDYHSFYSTLHYESSVVMGTLPVFYTGEFFETTPILFQFTKIYLFLLNPLVTILFIPSFFYVFYKALKLRSSSYILLTTFYLLLFLPQAFLFAKWTRYMVPTLPFIYLITALGISHFFHSLVKSKTQKTFEYIVIIILIVTSVLFSISYFITVFVKEDTRIQARNYARKNIDSNAQIVSEVYDLGIVPFNSSFQNITLFNFYELDNKNPEYSLTALNNMLEQTDYFILPSQRVFATRIKNAINFPNGYVFYEKVTQQQGLQKIYQTPCDIFCTITYMGDSVFMLEQTANIFDRPTVTIFKKK